MFDFEVFAVCVEALLFGTQKVHELFHLPQSTPEEVVCWRTTKRRRTQQPETTSNDMSSMTGCNKSGAMLQLINVSFHHEYKMDRKASFPAMRIGALFSGAVQPELGTTSSLLVLSKPLSRQDIVNHFQAINVVLDYYTDEEVLGLARKFVEALRNFRPGHVESTDEIVLSYPDLDAVITSPLSLKGGVRQTVPNEIVSSFIVPDISTGTTGETSLGQAEGEQIRMLLAMVRESRQTKDNMQNISSPPASQTFTPSANPAVGSSGKPSPEESKADKRKDAKAKSKRPVAVKQNRGAKRKLL